jgi:outer membrane lipoprotein SlyB
MRLILKAAVVAAALSLPTAAQAGTVEGVAIGAGAGAAIAGPPGAVVGGVTGAVVGGPNIVTTRKVRHCWRNKSGKRVCGYR